MKNDFAFKDLNVWKESIELFQLVMDVIENLNKIRYYRIKDQIISCTSSISQNIAEGKGRRSKKEFIHFLYIARGSLYETVSMIEIFHQRAWISDHKYEFINEKSNKIAKMLNALIKSIHNSVNR